jgi:predicted TIM-barrel fold metal-dependent hydrolase
MKVIDFRIRPPYSEFLKTAMYANAARRDGLTRAIGLEPSPAATMLSVELLMEEMRDAEVDLGVVVGRNSGALGSVSNEVVKQFCDLHPGRFVPVASIDPANRRAAIREIDACIGLGFKAVNIEPGGAVPPLHTDDRRLYPIYAHCEDRNIPLILMTGGNAGPDISFTAPERLDRMLADFPDLRVVSSHGNWPWVHQVLHVALRRPNLYLSPDYLMANMAGMVDFVSAANGWLSDRFVYASAFPFAPVRGYLTWFKSLPISPENMEKILGLNAARLLGL